MNGNLRGWHLFSLKTVGYFLWPLSLLLFSCDSSNTPPIQQINDETLLSDIELSHLESGSTAADTDIPQTGEIYYFGFDLRSSPQEDAAQYLPFLQYLEKATGYHFRLHFTPRNSSTVKELGEGKIQIAAMGAVSFLKTEEKYGAISLVRGLNHDNKTEYQAAFITRPESEIGNLNDIKGHSLAFGNRNSTQGHIIPRIVLLENEISLNNLSAYIYTGSHHNCAEAVVSGKFEVCALQDEMAKRLASQGLAKIIHLSSYYPSSGIVVSRSLPAEKRARIKQALLDFDPEGKHKEKLYHWNLTEMPKGFTVSGENDYDSLRHWLNLVSDLK